ncbi:hypothetical protein CNG04505 [Cryptococcus deneoformans JEC21]|uniref:Uncharacterized protein n=1 Tax=Cryptococcus deneoformans (strain JEC21 / ATCC MYA-565) TaxID=214684 RepID=A0A0S2M5R6_CRYD1|nr:hypothetical protein CNG04505 [Cryptococcus neoformans var. neoformans JEC21]ALO69321.1 hypothetical protein CNG04505 [Cryptococcus neoformans var. neoformans JEC21]
MSEQNNGIAPPLILTIINFCTSAVRRPPLVCQITESVVVQLSFGSFVFPPIPQFIFALPLCLTFLEALKFPKYSNNQYHNSHSSYVSQVHSIAPTSNNNCMPHQSSILCLSQRSPHTITKCHDVMQDSHSAASLTGQRDIIPPPRPRSNQTNLHLRRPRSIARFLQNQPRHLSACLFFRFAWSALSSSSPTLGQCSFPPPVRQLRPRHELAITFSRER